MYLNLHVYIYIHYIIHTGAVGTSGAYYQQSPAPTPAPAPTPIPGKPTNTPVSSMPSLFLSHTAAPSAYMYRSGNTSRLWFNYTGSYQAFKVPVGVTSITVTAYGAQGGTCTIGCGSRNGGLGGSIQAVVSVTPGQVLFVYVGGMGLGAPSGTSVAGGYNGGGSGDTYSSKKHKACVCVRERESFEKEYMYMRDISSRPTTTCRLR